MYGAVLFDDERVGDKGLVVPYGHVPLELHDQVAQEEFGEPPGAPLLCPALVSGPLQEWLHGSYCLNYDHSTKVRLEIQMHHAWANWIRQKKKKKKKTNR